MSNYRISSSTSKALKNQQNITTNNQSSGQIKNLFEELKI